MKQGRSFSGDGDATRGKGSGGTRMKGDGNGSGNGPIADPMQAAGGNKAHRSAMTQIGHGAKTFKGISGVK